MSRARRSAGTTRQLSLQQSASRWQQIRRQRSADEDKALHVLASSVTRAGKPINGRAPSEGPKVRIAWEEKTTGKEKGSEVEVIARQIPSRTKPTSGKAGRTSAEKVSILYSRQELAERLRLAWKHRQESRANIDIFLAHGTVEERCESRSSDPPTATESRKEKTDVNENCQDNGQEFCEISKGSSELFDRSDKSEFHPENVEKAVDVKAFESNGMKTEYSFRANGRQRKFDEAWNDNENDLRVDVDRVSVNGKFTKENFAEVKRQEDEIFEPIKNVEKTEEDPRKFQEGSYVNIDCLDDRSNCQLPSTTIILPSIKSENIVGVEKTAADFSSAKRKRASFQRAANRAFLIPMNEKSLSPTDKVGQTKTDGKFEQNAKRTNSAPPHGRLGQVLSGSKTHVNIVIDVPDISVVEEKISVDRKEAKTVGPKVSCHRAIRSAPLKRRSKSAKRRSFSSSKNDEDNHGKWRNRSSAGKGGIDQKTSDVVTMVSLVSSADSDSEIENSPLDDKLINELRSKLTTTPIIKMSNSPAPNAMRKPIKSVSFQRDSSDEDVEIRETTTMTKEDKRMASTRFAVMDDRRVFSTHDEATAKRKQEIPVTNLPMLCLLRDKTEVPEAPLTDREKRCLAVPIGEILDKKRKLLRTRSSPLRALHIDRPMSRPDVKEQQEETKVTRDDIPGNQSAISIHDLISKTNSVENVAAEEESPGEISEPIFQTAKERECWHLYRRMCDKGVSVSFDTVLRGMLTPTEYRIRQKHISQDS